MFDARAAKGLPPGQHLTIAPGLRLEAGKSARTWIYRFKSPTTGLMRQTKIGSWPEMSAAAATAAWEKLRIARSGGDEPAPKGRVAVGRFKSVRELCEAYLVGHVEVNRKLKGAKEVRRLFDTMLGDVAQLKPEAVTRSVAFGLINDHAATPVVARYLRMELGAAWDYAHDAGRLADDVPNWWRQILRGKLRSKGKLIKGERVKEKRALSAAEVGELIRWLPNFTRLVDDVLTLYLWTGTRGSEIVAMRASDVRKEADGVLWWTVPKERTKNAHRENALDLRVPLVGRAAEIVGRRLKSEATTFVFPGKGAEGHALQKSIGVAVYWHMPYSTTREDVQRRRLPVERWAPHDLRRTARTMLSSMGCSRDLAEVIVGHQVPGIAGIYDRHRYDAERLEWLTRLDRRLEELARG